MVFNPKKIIKDNFGDMQFMLFDAVVYFENDPKQRLINDFTDIGSDVGTHIEHLVLPREEAKKIGNPDENYRVFQTRGKQLAETLWDMYEKKEIEPDYKHSDMANKEWIAVSLGKELKGKTTKTPKVKNGISKLENSVRKMF